MTKTLTVEMPELPETLKKLNQQWFKMVFGESSAETKPIANLSDAVQTYPVMYPHKCIVTFNVPPTNTLDPDKLIKTVEKMFAGSLQQAL